MSERSDVIVVGGGLGGLGCAAMLARAGLSVRLVERASRVGGRALSPPVHEVALNLGAHALYLGGPGERWLGALGVAFDGFKPAASDAWLSDEVGVFPSPSSVFSLVGAGRFSFGERVGLLRFFATLDSIRPERIEDASASAWLDRVSPGPRARRFLEAMVRVSTYSNAPDVLPASIAVRQLQIAIGLRAKGVVYVAGGWESLVLGMTRAATDAGVRFTEGASVSRVCEDGRVELASGESLGAEHVVVALPRDAALRVAGVRTAPRATPARAACLDMILDGPVSRRLVFGLETPHYFSVHEPKNATGPLRAHAFRYLAPDEMGAEYKKPLLTWLERVVPDLREHVVGERFLPDMEVASALPRRDTGVPEMERVSFAGDWTSATHVLFDAVAESAEHAATRTLAALREKARAAA